MINFTLNHLRYQMNSINLLLFIQISLYTVHRSGTRQVIEAQP